eukprot:PLAT12685.1.p1 GENE.PLAT12685.1~~PLAT12685.1.p1  ORF type:complete len:182 (+),score=49.46 PLAT12685.1:200-745(+)
MGNCCTGYSAMEGSRLEPTLFDNKYKGKDVSIAHLTVSGTGGVLATTALHQDRVYFEMKIMELGSFCVGVARRNNVMETLGGHLGDGKRSWALKSETSTEDFKEGDVIGIAYDQSEGAPVASFYLNGEPLRGCTISRIKGLVYPAVSVGDGARVEANFSLADFAHEPPPGFSGIIPARSVI